MKKLITLILTAAAISFSNPSDVSAQWSGHTSTGTASASNAAPVSIAHTGNSSGPTTIIATHERNPDLQSSGFWKTLAAVCARIDLPDTSPWEGGDPMVPAMIGFEHYRELNFLLPDELKGNNCYLYFLKEGDFASEPWQLLNPTIITGIGIGWIF